MKIITQPKVQVISTQAFHMPEGFGSFLPSEAGVRFGEVSFEDGDITDPIFGPEDADAIPEFAGRLCYLSFGEGQIDGHKSVNGRPNNSDYIGKSVIANGHGSVLEHSVVGMLFEGISRSLSHELVRHRAGFSYSQLSQRYVDESQVAFVLPPEIPDDAENYLYQAFRRSCREATESYRAILESLLGSLEQRDRCPESKHEKFVRVVEEGGPWVCDFCSGTGIVGNKTDRLKTARQTARSVLPNATETKIVATANMRAWRTFIEQRGNRFADKEIRRLALVVYRQLLDIAPHIFADYSVRTLEDGTEVLETSHVKV